MVAAQLDRQPFVPEPREIRQLLRQRALERAGYTHVLVDLVGHRIVEKIDRRPESLDDKPALPPLTTPPGRV